VWLGFREVWDDEDGVLLFIAAGVPARLVFPGVPRCGVDKLLGEAATGDVIPTTNDGGLPSPVSFSSTLALSPPPLPLRAVVSGVTCAAVTAAVTVAVSVGDPPSGLVSVRDEEEDRSGVGNPRMGEFSTEFAVLLLLLFMVALIFAASTAAALIARLFISFKSVANRPGSAAVKAFTAGWTIAPI